MLYLFPVLVLLKYLPSCKMGQETLQCPHLEHPGFSLGGGLFAPTLLILQTVLFKFLGCFQPTWMFSPICLAWSFLTRYFLDSLIHWLIGGFNSLCVKIILTLLSVLVDFLCLKSVSLLTLLAFKILF